MSKTNHRRSYKRELTPAEERDLHRRAAERKARLTEVRTREEYGHRIGTFVPLQG